jgi:hypothetical protein
VSSWPIAAVPGEPAGQPSRDGSDIYPDLRERCRLGMLDGYWLVVPSRPASPLQFPVLNILAKRDGTVAAPNRDRPKPAHLT